MPFGIIAGVGQGIIGGLLGSSSQRKAERDQRRNSEQQIAATYNQQVAAWQFNEASEQLNYDFAKNSAKLQFEIEKAVALQQWRTQNNLEQARFIVDSTNLEIENLSANAQQQRDFDITRTLQEADHRAQVRAYEQSEKTYSQNTQLIARAATQGYQYEKARLSFERAGIRIDSQKIRQGFDDTKKRATNEAKSVEAQYRSSLRQAGLKGEELQRAVKEKMGQFTGQVDKTRREASGASATAAADGRTGASANRVMNDPFNQANFAIGAMGIELAYFGERQQAELYKLAEETNLAGYLADNQRAQLSQQVSNQERLSNLELGAQNLKERQSIFQANNNIRDNSLQAQSQMNEAESSRMLDPLRPVDIPNPLAIPRAFLPRPFETPRPLAATKGLQPFIPKRGLSAPEPVLGASPNITSQSGNILAQGILSGVGSGVSSYFANQAKA